jgi:hypothetical protein
VSLRRPHKLRSVRGDHECPGVFVLWSASHRGRVAACVRKPWLQAQAGSRPAQPTSAPSSINPFAALTPSCGSRATAAASWPASSWPRRTTRRRWSGLPSALSRSSCGPCPQPRSPGELPTTSHPCCYRLEFGSPQAFSFPFSWRGRRRGDAVEELDPPPCCAGVEDVLEDDYRRAYFLTGTVRVHLITRARARDF